MSLTADGEGRVAAATLSPSTGHLLVARRKDELGLALTAWEEIGRN